MVTMQDDIDKILSDIEAERLAKAKNEEDMSNLLRVDEDTAEKIAKDRKNKVSEFKLELDLSENESQAGDANPAANEKDAGEKKKDSLDAVNLQDTIVLKPENTEEPEDREEPRAKKGIG